MSINLNPTTPTGAPKFPLGNYKVRIMQEPDLKTSKKGNDMLVFKLETVEPATMQVDGVEREMAGWEWTVWAVYFTNDNGEMVNPTLASIHKQLGLPEVFEINPDTGLPEGVEYTGRELWIQGESQSSIVMDANKQPIVNPITGKPDTTENRRVIKVY